MKKLLIILALLSPLLHSQSQINSFQILRLGKQSTAPANPPINASYVYFDGTNVVCVTSAGASCFAGGGGSGTVTSVGLAGTANQITVTGSTPITGSGSWTLSFPSSLVLPSGTTATTQSASDNSTKVATTAYVDALSTGALVKICTLTATSSAALNFLAANCPNSANPFSSTYNEYLISVKNITPTTTGSALQMRMSTNGTSCDSGSSPGYGSVNFAWFAAGTQLVNGSAASGLSAMFVGDDHTSNVTANGGISSSLHLFSPASTTVNKNITGTTYNFNNAAGGVVGTAIGDSYQSTTAVLGFCLFFNGADTIASGSATVYGIVK